MFLSNGWRMWLVIVLDGHERGLQAEMRTMLNTHVQRCVTCTALWITAMLLRDTFLEKAKLQVGVIWKDKLKWMVFSGDFKCHRAAGATLLFNGILIFIHIFIFCAYLDNLLLFCCLGTTLHVVMCIIMLFRDWSSHEEILAAVHQPSSLPSIIEAVPKSSSMAATDATKTREKHRAKGVRGGDKQSWVEGGFAIINQVPD